MGQSEGRAMSVKTFTVPEGTLQISLAKPEMSSQHQETGRVKQPLGHDVVKDFKVASRILHLYFLAMFLEDFMSAWSLSCLWKCDSWISNLEMTLSYAVPKKNFPEISGKSQEDSLGENMLVISWLVLLTPKLRPKTPHSGEILAQSKWPVDAAGYLWPRMVGVLPFCSQVI